jgi:hypothetical protein
VLRLEVTETGISPTLVPFGRVQYGVHRIDLTPMLTSTRCERSYCSTRRRRHREGSP